MSRPARGPAAAPGHVLAPRGTPSLPTLRAVPQRLVATRSEGGLLDLVHALARAGEVVLGDLDPGFPAPGRLVERAVERVATRLNRRTSGGPTVCAFLRPWADVLNELCAGEADPGEARWAVGIDSSETYRLRVAPLVAVLGETATGVVLERLVRHTPLHVADGEELAWIVDGWRDRDEDTEEAGEIRLRALGADRIIRDLDRLFARGRAAGCAGIPHRGIRRLACGLSALDREDFPPDDTAWRETEDVDWSLPAPVVQLIWEDGCPLDHAADEAEFVLAQDGAFPVPQLMWLLDPADRQQVVTGWRRWLHALRRTRAATRLVAALDALSADAGRP
ncbi:MAG: hypothetical protein JWM27_4887 [Gemmatimonadetes bacterium]|nr:hypothetical protein [Gemmatimonadota bacterium]